MKSGWLVVVNGAKARVLDWTLPLLCVVLMYLLIPLVLLAAGIWDAWCWLRRRYR